MHYKSQYNKQVLLNYRKSHRTSFKLFCSQLTRRWWYTGPKLPGNVCPFVVLILLQRLFQFLILS